MVIMRYLISVFQDPISTDAERYLLIYMIGVLVVITGLIILFFVVFQKRKNKLLIDRLNRERHFEKELIKTQSEIQEQTLKQVGWELHDNIGQLLVYANMQMNMLSSNAPENLVISIKSTNDTVKKSLKEVRALSKSLNNDVLLNLGLKESVNNEVKRLRRFKFDTIELDVKGQVEPLQKSQHEIILFRILQEFFSNSIKYSEAQKINVELDYQSDRLIINAEDDGRGFDMSYVKKGSGLINMQSRADLIGATLKLESEPEKGVKLQVVYTY